MKLAYINKQLPYGSSAAFILPEVASHRAQGWDCWLVPLELGPIVHDRGLLDYTISAPLLSGAILGAALTEALRHPLRTARLLRQMLSARTPALCLRNLAVLPKGLWLGRKLAREGFEHIHIHFAAAPATMGVVAAHVAGLPYSITAHRYDIAQNNLLGWKMEHAQFTRVIDEPGAAEIAGYTGLKPVLLHMGVAVPASPAPLRGGVAEPLRVAIAARIASKKGHSYLVEAIALAKAQGVAVVLEIYGDGPLEGELRAQVEQLGIADSIVWHGAAAHQDLLRDLLSGRFDLFTLPSVTAEDGDKEGIPVSLIEAMGAGLPVLSTPNGGIAELIVEGCGILVPERDAPALAEALIRLARDGDLRQRLAQAGREHVLAHFEIEGCMRQLRALIAP